MSKPFSTINIPAALYKLPRGIFPSGTIGRKVSGRGGSSSPYRLFHAISTGRITKRTLDPNTDSSCFVVVTLCPPPVPCQGLLRAKTIR